MNTKSRGADLLAQSISLSGAEHIFSLSGNQIMPIYDALIDVDVSLYHVRQEAAAVHMADAWGRLTGSPGTAMVTAGPGFANALSAMYVARMAESPLVLISGQSSTVEAGLGAFQEMAQSHMAEPVTKASWTASDPSQLDNDIERAYKIAKSGRPGPVHLSIPVDTLEAAVGTTIAKHHAEKDRGPETIVDEATTSKILNLIQESQRPLMVSGPAMMRGNSRKTVDTLADVTGVPVVYMESPRGITDPSLGAFSEILAQADLVILIGKKLDFTLRLGRAPSIRHDCQFIQIDSEEATIAQTNMVIKDPRRIAITVVANPKRVARHLVVHSDHIQPRKDVWARDVYDSIKFRPPSWAAIKSEKAGPLHPAQVCIEVQKILGDDGIFVSDGGEFGQWAQACISTTERLTNGPSGAIGSGIPFAIAARLARPNAPIVATLGDGTFGFHAMEFDTAVRYDLPFVAVVGNDAAWNAEYQIQLRDYGADRLVGCELLPSRYDLLVDSLGGHGVQVSNASELTPALQAAMDSGVPSCVNIMTVREPAPLINHG